LFIGKFYLDEEGGIPSLVLVKGSSTQLLELQVLAPKPISQPF
jgi:hypothetical protein